MHLEPNAHPIPYPHPTPNAYAMRHASYASKVLKAYRPMDAYPGRAQAGPGTAFTSTQPTSSSFPLPLRPLGFFPILCGHSQQRLSQHSRISCSSPPMHCRQVLLIASKAGTTSPGFLPLNASFSFLLLLILFPPACYARLQPSYSPQRRLWGLLRSSDSFRGFPSLLDPPKAPNDSEASQALLRASTPPDPP